LLVSAVGTEQLFMRTNPDLSLLERDICYNC
jgi:hypothetical protein